MAAGRGSAKLLERWKVVEIDDDLMEKIAASVEDLEIVGILTKGTPAVDFLRLDLVLSEDDPDRCGNTIINIFKALHGYGHIPSHVRVFPKGIPVVDRFIVQLELGGE